MTIEYRTATAAEMPAFVYNDHVGFGVSTAPDALERHLVGMSVKPEMTLCAFEDGAPVANMATLPFVMRWNGRDVGCGGVTSVSTLPSHRRRGLVRELMVRSFATMRDAGQPVAMLYASMAAIYQRFGYGVAYARLDYDLDPRTLRFVDDVPTPGRMRLLRTEDAVSAIDRTYERFAAPRTLMLRRTAENWRWVLERPWRSSMTPWLVAAYEEAGETLGYAVYAIEPRQNDLPGPNQQLYITDFAWLTPPAHRALVQYLAGYDLAYSLRFTRLPADDALFFLAQEPRLLHAHVSDGTLLRIVDVERALTARGYDGDGRLTFSLADDLCPWNAGSWELAVEAGNATVRRIDGEAELCLTPRSLAILASGCLSATALAHMGHVAAADERSLGTADAIFRTAWAPLCLDPF